jgi:hypothetical protein
VLFHTSQSAATQRGAHAPFKSHASPGAHVHAASAAAATANRTRARRIL